MHGREADLYDPELAQTALTLILDGQKAPFEGRRPRPDGRGALVRLAGGVVRGGNGLLRPRRPEEAPPPRRAPPRRTSRTRRTSSGSTSTRHPTRRGRRRAARRGRRALARRARSLDLRPSVHVFSGRGSWAYWKLDRHITQTEAEARVTRRLERDLAAEALENAPVPSRVRLADLLAGLSIAIDLGFGLPPETAMRSCLVATRLARAHGLAEPDIRDSFFTSLLLHVGCPGFSHETAALFGNELAVTRAVARTNLADPTDYQMTLIPEATRGLSQGTRRQVTERLIRDGPAFGEQYDTASCEVASRVAARLGIGAGVERALYEVAEWWNGGGAPQGLREDAIVPAARVAHLAADAVVLQGLGGVVLTVDGLRARAGSVLDPNLVETFVANASDILEGAAIPANACSRKSPNQSTSEVRANSPRSPPYSAMSVI